MPNFNFDPMAMFRIRNILQGMDESWGDTPAPAMPELANTQDLPSPVQQMPVMAQFDSQPLPEVVSQDRINSFEDGTMMPPEIDYDKRMLELYKPEHSASERLREIVGRMPERNNPGIMRKIAASFLGFGGGPQAADLALYAPYYNAMSDWKNEYGPARDMAQEERYSNNNARMLANNILAQQMSDRRIDRQIARDKWQQNQGERRLGQGDKRLEQGQEIVDLRKKEFGLKEKLAEGGQIIVDSKTGQTYLLDKKGELSTLPIDQLSFEEKEILRTNQKIRADKATPDKGQRDRLQLKVNADGSYEVINLDQGVGKGVIKAGTGTAEKPAEPVKAPVKPTTELDKQRALNAKAIEVKSKHPEWEKWIQIDKSGRFVGIKDKSWFGDEATYNKIYQAIYGTAPTTTNPANPAKTPPPVSERKIGMEFTFSNGNVGKWDGSKWVPVKIVKR